jgi:hypothetical protein
MDPITAFLASLGEMFTASAPAALGEASGAWVAPGAMGAGEAAALGQGATSGGLFEMLGGAKDAIMAGGLGKELKTLLPKSSEEAMASIKDKSGFGGIEKAYTTITDPKLDFRGKFDVLAPEAYKRAMEGQAQFGQIQQGSQPMQMPSYQQPYSQYQGGGIQEILKRQQGLLR